MKYRVLLSVVFSALLAGCNSLSQQDTPEPRTITWSDDVTQSAQLIRHLPDDTLLYARIPSLVALIGAPKPNAMGQLLESDANEAALRQLFAGARNELETAGPFGPLAGLLLERLRSPLEVAVRVPAGASFTAAEINLSARLDFESADDLQRTLDALATRQPAVRLQTPVASDRPGFMNLGVLPAYYAFDAVERRFTLTAGFSVSPERLDGLGRTVNEEHPALARQNDMDDSGYGLYVWADAGSILPLVTPFIPAQQRAELSETGVLEIDEFALGVGTANGRGQTVVYARGQNGRLWDLGLPAGHSTGLTTLDAPRLYASMTLPDADWIRQVAELTEFDPEQADDGLAIHGLDWETVAGALAGRLSVIEDEAGRYSALEPADPEAFARLLDHARKREWMSVARQDYRGRTIESWYLPTADLFTDVQEPMMRLLLRSQNSRAWVMREGDLWLLAAVPQVLMARADRRADFPIEPWLEAAGEPTANRSLVVMGTLDQRVQANYHTYLETLQILADMVDAPVDLMTFPPAYARALPETSTASFSASYQDRAIRLVYGYENHPFDALGGGTAGMTGVAIVGILAAVAIPQYHEYVVRAEAANGWE